MLNSNIKIIPFKAEHLQAVEILLESISQEFSEPISTNNATKSNLIPDLYLVAIAEHKVVGTISITRLENNNSVLRKMFLHKHYRGQGIAELLLQHIINWTLENNISAIYLGTMTQFNAAQKFYEKHNFTQIQLQLLPIDFPINPIDSLFYKLNLNLSIR